MTLIYSNPESLHKPSGYTHVVQAMVENTVWISGQIAMDVNGKLVGEGDLEAQTTQVFENLKSALASFGAGFEHVVKMMYFVVDMKPEYRDVIVKVRDRYLPDKRPASSLLGVSALALPGLMIEIEVVAVHP